MTDVPLLLPDSEDRENLLKNGVTHILSIHNSAKPVLEVSSPGGGGPGGPPRGNRGWEDADGTHAAFSWRGAEREEATLGFAPVVFFFLAPICAVRF